jgi:WD40 repeat protein
MYRFLLSLSFALSLPAVAQNEPEKSLGPLKRLASAEIKPDFLAKTLGATGGLPYGLGDEVAKIPIPDHWLVETADHFEKNFLCLMKLNRATGESTLVQRIEAGGNWCYIPKGNFVFAGRNEQMETGTKALPHHKEIKRVYECFELSTNQSLWTLSQESEVLSVSLSHDGNQLIVLNVGDSDGRTGHGPTWLSWHDIKTGKQTRKINLPGRGNTQPEHYGWRAIVDTPEMTYVTRYSMQDYQVLQVRRNADSAEQLEGGGERFEGTESIEPGHRWFVEGSDDFKWLAFHNTQQVVLFKREGAELKEVEAFSEGFDMMMGDDVRNVRFTPKSTHLIVGSMKGTKLYDLAAGKIAKEFKAGTFLSEVTDDSSLLVFWHDGGSWPVDLKTGKEVGEKVVKPEIRHTCPVTALSYSSDGKYLVSGDYRHFVVWDMATGKALASLASPKEKDPDFGGISSPLIVDKHGKVYGADGWDILEWDLEKIRNNRSTEPLMGVVAFGRKGNRDRALYNIDIAVDKTGERFVEADMEAMYYFTHANPSQKTRLQISSDDLYRPRKFHFTTVEGALMVANLGRSLLVGLNGTDPQVELKKKSCLITSSDIAYSTSSQRGKMVVSRSAVGDDDLIGQDQVTIEDAPFSFEWSKIDVTEDGKLFIYQNTERLWDEISVYDWAKKQVVRTFKSPSEIKCSKISPDGRYLATAGIEGKIYLWDLSGL